MEGDAASGSARVRAARMARRKPRVWLVDDLGSSRERFAQAHREHFEVRTFPDIARAMAALEDGMPDVLLCDVFFFPDEHVAEEVERLVAKEVQRLRRFAASHEVTDDKKDGLRLIRHVAGGRFRGRFLVYAYTAKGPFMLTADDYNLIVQAGARFLPKGRLSPHAEYVILSEDVAAFRREHPRGLAAGVRRNLRQALAVASILGFVVGALVSWVLERVLDAVF